MGFFYSLYDIPFPCFCRALRGNFNSILATPHFTIGTQSSPTELSELNSSSRIKPRPGGSGRKFQDSGLNGRGQNTENSQNISQNVNISVKC